MNYHAFITLVQYNVYSKGRGDTSNKVHIAHNRKGYTMTTYVIRVWDLADGDGRERSIAHNYPERTAAAILRSMRRVGLCQKGYLIQIIPVKGT